MNDGGDTDDSDDGDDTDEIKVNLQVMSALPATRTMLMIQ